MYALRDSWWNACCAVMNLRRAKFYKWRADKNLRRNPWKLKPYFTLHSIGCTLFDNLLYVSDISAVILKQPLRAIVRNTWERHSHRWLKNNERGSASLGPCFKVFFTRSCGTVPIIQLRRFHWLIDFLISGAEWVKHFGCCFPFGMMNHVRHVLSWWSMLLTNLCITFLVIVVLLIVYKAPVSAGSSRRNPSFWDEISRLRGRNKGPYPRQEYRNSRELNGCVPNQFAFAELSGYCICVGGRGFPNGGAFLGKPKISNPTGGGDNERSPWSISPLKNMLQSLRDGKF